MIRLTDESDNTNCLSYVMDKLNLSDPDNYNTSPYIMASWELLPSDDYDNVLRILDTSYDELDYHLIGALEDATYRSKDLPRHIVEVTRDYSSRDNSITIKFMD